MEVISNSRGRIDRRGFTLIELMVVIGLIVLIVAFAAPAIRGLSGANNVSTAGRLVTNLLTAARSEAINSRSLIRFQIATTWPANPADAYRKVVLVKHDLTTGSDVVVTNWQTLPSGVVFQDPSTVSGLQTQAPKLTVGTQQVTSYYLEFLPTGAANVPISSSPVTLKLQAGYSDAGATPTVTAVNNWYNVSVDALVGRIAVARP